MVVPSQRGDSAAGVHPVGVFLFLTGAGHVDDRDDFLVGGVDLLLRNENVLEECYILEQKPAIRCGPLRANKGERLQWDQHDYRRCSWG